VSAFHSDVRIQVTDGTVSQRPIDIEPNQGSAATENESHEPTDRAVFLDPVTVVNPNQRQVLHIVEDFEQGDAGENVRYALLQYHQNATLVIKSASFTGFCRVPATHIRP